MYSEDNVFITPLMRAQTMECALEIEGKCIGIKFDIFFFFVTQEINLIWIKGGKIHQLYIFTHSTNRYTSTIKKYIYYIAKLSLWPK